MLHLPELHERPVEDCGEGNFITSSTRMDFPSAQPKPPADGKIIFYPPGVKEITDKITNDEVVKRLKMVVKTFMDMDQDSEDEKQQYLPLALHLASEFFLRNPNKDVRLLVACCLADIFRIYAPEAPYTSHDKLKDIFLFITRQLKGLEDTKSPQFNRYFYLLENLAWVKSYNICFELEDCNEIFIQLFRTLFSVINNSHNQKVQMHMLDLMSSIIMEGDGVTQELLDSILINLIPAHKNLNKQAFDLAKVLLKRTVQTIEPCIANFFNQVLVLGKSSVSDLSEHVFDLIQELFAIDPNLLLSVMPQLEFKLKSNDGEERLAVVRLLAKLFGSKDSDLATQNRPLWQCFLGRFNDIHVPVRLESVKFASHCLMNHPDLAKDLTEYLKVRSHDPEEAIRHDVIVTIITAGKRDLSLVNDQLLGFVRERTLDKRWRVRKEAMMGLAQLYKKYCLHAEAGKDAAEKVSWIKDKLLHIYYQNSIDDNALVKLMNKSIEGTADDEEEGVSPDTAIRSGLELLKVLSFTHPTSFHSAETYESLLQCLRMEDDKVAEAAIQIFRNTGHKIETDLPQIRSTLIPILHQKAKRGTPHQAKQAVHCIHAIFTNKEVQLAQIFEPLSRSLNADVPEQLITPLVSLGHISMLAPDQFASPMKSVVANFIVKDLLMNDRSTGEKNGKLWSPDEEVSPEVLAKVQAIKLLVRWLLGMKNNQSKSANSTLRLLSAMLVSEGDLTEQKRISKSDMSRLRLAAGSAIMKLAQEPCYHEIITPEQFQLCALVINDECYQVRQIFAQKLHKALVKLLLPLEYMAIFALCAKDPVKERRAHARQCLLKNISIRREYIKQNPMANEKLLSLLPEYVVPYMIHLLAHDPDFTKPQDVDQLRDIKECLWFMLEVLMTKNENNSHAFMKKMTESIKLTRDAQSPDEPKANEKLYTVCDVALCVINSKSALCNADSPKDPVLPTKFFTQPEKDFCNDRNYISEEMRVLLLTGKPKPTGVLGAVNKPLSATGRRPYIRSTGPETGSNNNVNSELSSPAGNRSREQSSDISETGVSENDENPVRIISITPAKIEPVKSKEINSDQVTQGNVSTERGKKRTAAAAGTENIHQKLEENKTDETGQPAPPKPRRGRPPKSESQGTTAKNAETSKPSGRGRKRAAPNQEGPGGLEASNAKAPKQQDTVKKAVPAQRQIDLQRSKVLGSDGDSVLEVESSPGYSPSEMDLFKLCESSQEDTEETELTEGGFLKVKRKLPRRVRKGGANKGMLQASAKTKKLPV
ncbi:sister chromatid cohesion protein PDS5 homolog A isoform X5 [Hemicordylus capensis]|uniref:sister chromatid cohesion protein PDS5 homolog A isoform X5 n=1 Tax=Hemicordylus capensis TaxID=884348 RepID=UPI0023032119|nr:sister chromatid cohesion protein PDS5 homolog A isoform X5 [Hemicordylus capensis]